MNTIVRRRERYSIFLTRHRSTIIGRKKEAEGLNRRANRLDTEIRSPKVEGEVDYAKKSGGSGRGPGANAQSISRTRLGAIASVGGLRTVAATDRPTGRFLLGINSFNTPAAAAVNTLSQVNSLQTQGSSTPGATLCMQSTRGGPLPGIAIIIADKTEKRTRLQSSNADGLNAKVNNVVCE